MRLHIPARLEREFKKRAKAAYPKETLAYVLGTMAGDQIQADELYWPDDLDKYCTPDCVMIPAHWLSEAQEAARESGLSLIADLHSHPYKSGVQCDRTQSEADVDRSTRLVLGGVCVVYPQSRRGLKTLRASIRWWPPMIPLDVKKI